MTLTISVEFHEMNCKKNPSGSLMALIYWGAVLVSLAACATNPVSTAELQEQPALTVKWLPPCSSNITEPYFSVDVFEDGRVRYVGGEEARERGERQLQVSREQAQLLISSIRGISHGSKKPAAKVPGRPLPEYCLEVSEYKSGKTIVVKAPGIEKRMKPVINKIGTLVEENKWVCPSRGTVRIDSNTLENAGFCGIENAYVVAMTTFDKSSCIANSIAVHSDVIHYTASSFLGEAGVSRNLVSVLADEYYVINTDEFAQILNTARTLDFDPIDPQRQFIGNYGSSKTEVVLRLKQAIDKVVSIKLAELPEGTPVCHTGWEHRPTVSLYYKYGPLLNP